MSKPLLALFIIVCLLPQVAFPKTLTFTKIAYMQPVDEKIKDIKAKLELTNQSIRAYNAKTGETLSEVLWRDLKALTYSKSKHPRWKQLAGRRVFDDSLPIYEGKEALAHRSDCKEF